MPVSAPTDPNPTPVLPPRRTWRDLPATPPVADFLPPPDPDHLVAEAAAGGEEPPTDEPAAVPGPGQPRSRKRTWLAVGLVAALFGAVGGIVWTQGSSSGSTSTTPTVAPPKDPGSQSSVEQVAKALGPAVVQIEVGQGLGSGVVYDGKGLILTAHHVVEGTDDVTVRTADKQELKGRVVGRAPEKDLAIVAVKPTSDLPAAPLAEAGSVEVGETAIALGSPFGYQQTVTAGIVSGLDREIDSPVGKLTGLIQTDAPINPGNSGGPAGRRQRQGHRDQHRHRLRLGRQQRRRLRHPGRGGQGPHGPGAEGRRDRRADRLRPGRLELVRSGQHPGPREHPRPGPDPRPRPDPRSRPAPAAAAGPPPRPGLRLGLAGRGAARHAEPALPGLGDMLGGGQGSQGQDNGQGQQGGQATPAPDNGSGSQASPSSLSLVEVPSPPKGYTQERTTPAPRRTGGQLEGTQPIVLAGARARSPSPPSAATRRTTASTTSTGKATQINGHKAVAMDHGYAFLTDDGLLVMVRGGAQVSDSDVKAIAEAVEVQ